MSKLPAVAALLLVCQACGFDIAYTPSNPAPHPMVARAPESVEILRLAPNDRPYVEVGVLDATGYWGDGPERVDALLRDKAAELGCDALVIQGYVQQGARYRAICLAFRK